MSLHAANSPHSCFSFHSPQSPSQGLGSGAAGEPWLGDGIDIHSFPAWGWGTLVSQRSLQGQGEAGSLSTEASGRLTCSGTLSRSPWGQSQRRRSCRRAESVTLACPSPVRPVCAHLCSDSKDKSGLRAAKAPFRSTSSGDRQAHAVRLPLASCVTLATSLPL